MFLSLTDSATISEENNYIDGNVEKGSMFSVCVLGLIIVFILIFILHILTL